jgi:SAM-dependent methyltransferase
VQAIKRDLIGLNPEADGVKMAGGNSNKQVLNHLMAGVPAAGGQFILERRARLVRPLFRCLDFPPEGRHLVDFGCGNGAQTLLFAGDFDRVTGVDVSKVFLEDFRREIVTHGLEDRIIPVGAAEWLHENLQDSQLTIYEDGHGLAAHHFKPMMQDILTFVSNKDSK